MLKGEDNNIFIQNKIIDPEDTMILLYGLEVLKLKLLHVGIFLITGLIFNNILMTLMLYISLYALRSYTGGFHSKKSSLCLFYSFIICLLFNLYAQLPLLEYAVFIVIFSIAGIVIIMKVTPIEYEDNPLSLKEKTRYKSIIRLVCISLGLSLVLAIVLNMVGLIALCSYTIILDFVLITLHYIFFKKAE